MIIEESKVKLDSSHELNEFHKSEERLVQWIGGEKAMAAAYQDPVDVNLSNDTLNKLRNIQNSKDLQHATNLSPAVSSLKNMTLSPKKAAEAAAKGIDSYLSEADRLKIKLIEELFYLITGEKIKIKIFNPAEETKSKVESEDIAAELMSKIKGSKKSDEPERVGWGLDYSYSEFHHEVEKTEFSAKAKVKTADGRSIDIDLSLKMSREFIQQKNISIKAGDALIDPLVINFHGNGADLLDEKFEFDLDMDGKKDQISRLGQGSGFLAYDFNSDGKINDGGELFGPSTGSGFKELEKFDEDENGWIDENDKIFEGLRIWTSDSSGNEKLLALGETGIGAIFLGKADTEFALKSENSNNGRIRESGFYLKENGSAGLLHELDLVV